MGTNIRFSFEEDQKFNRSSWPNHVPFWIHQSTGKRNYHSLLRKNTDKKKQIPWGQKWKDKAWGQIEKIRHGDKMKLQLPEGACEGAWKVVRDYSKNTLIQSKELRQILVHCFTTRESYSENPRQLMYCSHQSSLTSN